MQPSPNNTRYILELERNRLVEETYNFDEKYGTFSFVFLATVENLALVAYLYIAAVLMCHKKSRTKINLIVSIWAVVNATVLVEKLLRLFDVFFEIDLKISDDTANICQMIAAVGRSYGTSLAVIWLFSKYSDIPKLIFELLNYLLIFMPAFVGFYFIFYYFNVNKFIYEVYGPGSDIVNLAVYLLVGFIFVLSKIFVNTTRETTQYALIISLVNLITNFPVCLITIYLRFNLDYSWFYRFHIYWVDFFINVINCSNAFVVMFFIILYNRNLRNNYFSKKHVDSDENNYC
ncbi:hypothetical protein BDFB_006971 [Asbolus verrucosus]|uniref:Uncharacterized protein n=1 Tax=Asbolus verrucosus TaxID=1661398 RepID=A0A482V1G5_ASBVE|nr:hypothetical protein BDFB_006971 [Asbolus verrucosus]